MQVKIEVSSLAWNNVDNVFFLGKDCISKARKAGPIENPEIITMREFIKPI
jgi:hypothetical protein